MNAVEIIIKKRDKGKLDPEEIDFFINGFCKGEIPDYQASALAMAILLNGMTIEETIQLTLSMAYSGEVLDLSKIVPFAIDKHSTGGVGDKTSLVIVPLIRACGLPVAKMSGRGLSFSGGTLDKIESIPGFRTNLSGEEFMNQLESIGMVLSGQSPNLAPADGKLYKLRDVTGTVESLPLIAASIMSKKIAVGANGIVLDVKVGSGAFMKNVEEARELAELMVLIAKQAGLRVTALLSDMNQPLGEAVGNALELIEAIDVLKGNGPQDFKEHCIFVAGHMLNLAQSVNSVEQGIEYAREKLASGHAWKKFRELVQAQGGDATYIDYPEKLPQSNIRKTINASETGFLRELNARNIGEASLSLGAGRIKKDDVIDQSVGIKVYKKVGNYVHKHEPIVEIFANTEKQLKQAEALIIAGVIIGSDYTKLPEYYGVFQ